MSATTNKPKKMSYHFDCGNSTTGPIGFCADVTATSKKEAVKFMNDLIRDHEEDISATLRCLAAEEGNAQSGEALQYLNIYLGRVTEKHIDEVRDIEEE